MKTVSLPQLSQFTPLLEYMRVLKSLHYSHLQYVLLTHWALLMRADLIPNKMLENLCTIRLNENEFIVETKRKEKHKVGRRKETRPT